MRYEIEKRKGTYYLYIKGTRSWIKSSTTCKELNIICKMLNSGELKESWVKNTHGVAGVMKIVELVNKGYTIKKVDALNGHQTGVSYVKDNREMRIILNQNGCRLGHCGLTCQISRIENMNIDVAVVRKDGNPLSVYPVDTLLVTSFASVPEEQYKVVKDAVDLSRS